jgi:hypothetical protein
VLETCSIRRHFFEILSAKQYKPKASLENQGVRATLAQKAPMKISLPVPLSLLSP